MHHFRIYEGKYWCENEDVISEECTDYDRCNNECVCNFSHDPLRTFAVYARFIVEAVDEAEAIYLVSGSECLPEMDDIWVETEYNVTHGNVGIFPDP